MYNFTNVTKALSDESRARIFMILITRKLCVQQVVSMLELAPSTVSKHISILQNARLITSFKRGKWVIYSMIDKKENPDIEEIIRFVSKGLEKTRQYQEDEIKIKKIEKEHCLLHGEIHNL